MTIDVTTTDSNIMNITSSSSSSSWLSDSVYTLGFRAGQAFQNFSIVDYWSYFPVNTTTTTSSTPTTASPKEIWNMITSFPLWYRTWWISLLKNDPVHLFVETTLLLSVLYMFLTRTKDWGESKSSNNNNNSNNSKNASNTGSSAHGGVSTGGGGMKEDKLTKQEEDESILEWQKKFRKPLVDPVVVDSHNNNYNSSNSSKRVKLATAKDVPQFVVHQINGTNMIVTMDDEPTKYKLINFGTFDFLGMSAEFTSNNNNNNETSNKTITTKNNNIITNNNNKLEEIKEDEKKEDDGDGNTGGESIVKNNEIENNGDDENSTLNNNKKSKKKKKKKKKKNSNNSNNNENNEDDVTAAAAAAATTTLSVASDATTTSTTATNNNNNSNGNSNMKQASVDALERYGCGACGPRGFYGTVDPHLALEDEMAKFMNVDQSILYSDGASGVSSTIAAFCKRGDLLVVDEAVREPVIAGVKLSRAYVKWFKHNDMDDLRQVLESVAENDKQLGRLPNAQRRFIICEGLYKNTGLIAPLDKIVAMKHEFHYRLFLDESYSFGTLGRTGKGALELYNKRIMYDAEIVTIALENALGSIGGVTLGSEEVVDHQRLSGSGYCFSAASPPFTASAAIASLNEFKNRSKELLDKLNENKQYMYDKLQTFCQLQEDLILISSDIRSPIVFLVLAECEETKDIDDTVFLSELVRECIRRGIGMISTGQHNSRAGINLLRVESQPTIRMSVSAAHTKKDIDFAVEVLSESLSVVMKRYVDGEI